MTLLCICIYIYISVCISIYIDIFIYVYVSLYIYTYFCICIFVYTCTYANIFFLSALFDQSQSSRTNALTCGAPVTTPTTVSARCVIEVNRAGVTIRGALGENTGSTSRLGPICTGTAYWRRAPGFVPLDPTERTGSTGFTSPWEVLLTRSRSRGSSLGRSIRAPLPASPPCDGVMSK